MLNICLQITSENAGLTVFLIALISVLAVLIIKFALYKYKWSLKRIDKMKGADFEDFMKSVYELLGYRVQKTKKSGDQGIDLIIKKHFKSTGIQLKRYSGTVGNSAVQEAVAGKRFYKLDRICVLTNTYFTKSAIELAKANKVELLNREDLALLIKKAKKKAKRGK